MSLRWKLVIVAVLVGMAAIYGEFVLDIRAPDQDGCSVCEHVESPERVLGPPE